METLVIKKSPISIIRHFILFQILAAVFFFVSGYLVHYAKFYRALGFSQVLSFQVAEIAAMLALEIGFIFLIFLWWYKDFVVIKKDTLIHGWGIILHERMSIARKDISSVTFKQSLFGRLTKYGMVTIKTAGEPIILKDIPDPQVLVDLILNKISVKSLAPLPQIQLEQLLQNGEHENLEFKSTFRWDVMGNKVNKIMERAAMKTIAAFLNSNGGHLVLGVSDAREILGMSRDFDTLGRKDADGFENHFSHVFLNMIGAEFRQYVRLDWHVSDGKECCVVQVNPSHTPVYVRSDENEEFFIRTGNSTTSLRFSQAAAYIDSRFRGV
ncbi:MAG: RNA-binding domain-containing protein [Patescibacteria group bacterium]